MKRVAMMSLLIAACSGGESGEITAKSKIVNPETCKDCHPNHYAQWRGSMHAYAGDDPVFLAMNERGQRETQGELGDFCVNCHAPMAVKLGLTDDGLNLAELPQQVKGVTCYYCHNVTDVEGTHNNPLLLAMDRTMRGPISDPFDGGFHEAQYSSEQDGRTLKSGDMCGSCHDIVTPAGVHLERTYSEWLYSFFSNPDPINMEIPDQQFFGQTCNQCHMPSDPDKLVADVEGVPGGRLFHDHRFVGVDVQLTPFPDEASAAEVDADQREGIEAARQTSLCASLCVQPGEDGAGDAPVVWLHNEQAGHHWPSGAKQDRRAWIQVVAYDANDQVLYQTGVVPEGTPVVDMEAADPDMWVLRDKIFDDKGEEVHMFWEARSYEESHLPVAETFFGDPGTWTGRVFPALSEPPARVTLNVYLRPMGLEVLDNLVASGDLDPVIRDRMETFEVPNVDLVWTPHDPNGDDSTNILSDTYGNCVSSSKVCRSPFINCAFLGKEHCDDESVCTWTEAELSSQTGWCSGCPAWTDQASCEEGTYCLWDGAACVFNKCIDEAQQGKCEDMTDCGWTDPDGCGPCSTQDQAACTAASGCAWDGAACVSCAGQDEAGCGALTGCAWDADACVPG